MTTKLGIAVIGMGWMGNEHSRAIRQINYAFPEYDIAPELVITSDNIEERARNAQRQHGFKEWTTDWKTAVSHPQVDVVVVTTPNMLHKEICFAVVNEGKAIFCEKPVGLNPTETREVALKVAEKGVISGSGFNYRWMPAVQYAKNLRDSGKLGDPLLLQCFFYSRFGDSPDALWTWRFSEELSGTGATSDVMTHCADMAHYLNGPIESVIADRNIFYKERPYAEEGDQFGKAAEGLPTRTVTNDDYASALVRFRNGSSGFFECSRALYGPKNPFDVRFYGKGGSFRWNLEQMNQLELDLRDKQTGGYTTILSGPQFPDHTRLAPGEGTGLSYADSVMFGEARFLKAVADQRPHSPAIEQAAQVGDVLEAVARSWQTGNWEKVDYTFTNFETALPQ